MLCRSQQGVEEDQGALLVRLGHHTRLGLPRKPGVELQGTDAGKRAMSAATH
jgi:hypothetical protein